MKLSHDARALVLALMGGIPALGVAIWLTATTELSGALKWTIAAAVVGWWVALAVMVRSHVVSPVRTLSALLAALREGDYSSRARVAKVSPGDDPMDLALREANALADVLYEQRLGALDASALLRKVMEEIDVAVLAFDHDDRLRLCNRAAEQLLGRPGEQVRGRAASALDLEACLSGPSPRLLEPSFGPGGGRWELRRATFRQRGRPYQLLVLSDLSRALQTEEREAWQRLVRVLSHEINNSLTPISSIANSLKAAHATTPRAPDWDEDLSAGLDLIAGRAEGLGRFMAAHAKLARLPSPTLGSVSVPQWIERVVALERTMKVAVDPGPELTIEADGDQLDQLLINLIANAVDAATETDGAVRVGWSATASELSVWVIDDGKGLADTANLFVPFYSTKPGGSGIGLALARQIAAGHRGRLTLKNRDGAAGCEARLTLPRPEALTTAASR